MIIDDYLPVKRNGSLAFARSDREGEIWMCLLEKAWAKLHGTYMRSAGGLPSFAACHVMGVPADSRHHSSMS